jgi:hypothetical protein
VTDVYGWIWRRLPGTPPTRAAAAVALVVAVLALLWFVVFPAMESLMPYVEVSVGSS